MAGGCCSKPISRIIKVGEFETGLMGLDQALGDVIALGLADEEEIQRELLRRIREFGNYLLPSREDEYGKALLREYRTYLRSQKRPDPSPRRGAPGSPKK